MRPMLRLLIPSSVLLLSLAANAQEARYNVEILELDPPERKELDVSVGRLPLGAGGAVPTTDGAPFALVLSSEKAVASDQEEVEALLDELLPALGWDGVAAELELEVKADPLALPDAEALKREQAAGLSAMKSALTDKLGELSDELLAGLDEAADQTWAQVWQDDTHWFFAQTLDGVRCEGMGVSLITDGRTARALSGALYTDLSTSNKMAVDLERALVIAEDYVGEYTRVVEVDVETAEAVVVADGDTLRFAWRMDVETMDGPYRVWVDAETLDPLQVLPLFMSVSASGLAFDYSPNEGTASFGFEIDAASGGVYRLGLSGEIVFTSSGADGTAGALELTDDGSGSANFDVSPYNATSNVTDPAANGYNPWFQHVHSYAWVYDLIDFYEIRGSEDLPTINATINDDDPCGFGPDNACGWKGNLIMGAGLTGAGTSTNNAALDATVLVHEFGHGVHYVQTEVTTGVVNFSASEGLSDYWSMSRTGQDTFGAYWGQNGAPVQTGWTPRQAEAQDVWPDHLTLGGNESHANGQMLAWALWSTRAELMARNPLGAYATDMYLLKALRKAGVGQQNTTVQKRVHDAFIAILTNMLTEAGSGQDAQDILAGFARAGLFTDDRVAIVSISDDYLSSTATTPPTFTVWTGRDWTWNGNNTQASNAWNTHWVVEVATDTGFTTGLISSGDQTALDTTRVPTGSWTMPAADWDTLRASATRFYYRVTTTDDAGANERVSTSWGAVTLPPNVAYINAAGEMPGCCDSCSSAGRKRGGAALVSVAAALALLRRRRERTGDKP